MKAIDDRYICESTFCCRNGEGYLPEGHCDKVLCENRVPKKITQNMKAKDTTTGEIIDVTPAFGGYFSCNGNLIPQGDLEFDIDPPQPEATISGWVARDKGCTLNKLHLTFPRRLYAGMAREAADPNVWYSGGNTLILPRNLFPDLTYQDEPVEVEIIIKPKKQ